MKPLKEQTLSRRAFLRDTTATTGSLVVVSAISTLTNLSCKGQPATSEHNMAGSISHGGRGSYVTGALITEGNLREGIQNGEHVKIYTVFFRTWWQKLN